MRKIIFFILVLLPAPVRAEVKCKAELSDGIASIRCSHGDQKEARNCSFSWPLKNSVGVLMGWTGFFTVAKDAEDHEVARETRLDGMPIVSAAGPANIVCTGG
jgi:hypothetical protein